MQHTNVVPIRVRTRNVILLLIASVLAGSAGCSLAPWILPQPKLSTLVHTEADVTWKTGDAQLMAKDIRWRFLSDHPDSEGGLKIWGSYAFRFVNLTSKPLKITGYNLRFKDKNGLGVGGIYAAGLWTDLQIEIPPNGEAEQGHRFDISAGNLQEVMHAASMQIVGVRMQ